MIHNNIYFYLFFCLLIVCQNQQKVYSQFSQNITNSPPPTRMQQIDQTEVMQQNLQRIINSQNYFSCFFDNNRPQEQPANPFRKKMFDKNLRRSTMSCSHYNSTSIQNQSERQIINMSSSRKSINNKKITVNDAQPQQHKQKLQIQGNKKMTLAQSRHSDPDKQQITQIINSFRLELDYLEEKLHKKVDEIGQKYEENQSQLSKQRQVSFMIGSLEKIVGFMIENCVNLEDTVMYGSECNQSSRRESNHGMRREIFQIQDQQYQGENISFGEENYRRTTRTEDIRKKQKVVRFREEEKENDSTQQNDMPNTFYVNDKLHSNQKTKTGKSQKQLTKINRQEHTKQIHRPASKYRYAKSNLMNQSDFHYHSSKENFTHSYTSSVPDNYPPTKSIYETVLQEREMRMKMKKKMI